MKFCRPHWEELKKAVDERGLTPFIASSGAEAVKRMTGESAKFEPLMYAHNAIVSNAMGVAGLVLMENNDDGSERCPICFLVAACQCGKGADCPFNTWITKAADDALEGAKHHGLVAKT